jgi:hypothetical protein
MTNHLIRLLDKNNQFFNLPGMEYLTYVDKNRNKSEK